MMSTFFIRKPLSKSKVFQVCHYFVFPGLLLDGMVATSLTSPNRLYRLELHLDRLFLVYQQGFFLSAGLLRKL